MIKFIKSSTSLQDFVTDKKQIVFVGRSNVGKSSLINALYKQKIAFQGKTPGKTKLINFFDVNGEYMAVDVPGYGYAKRSKQEAINFSKMMDNYFSMGEVIKLVILISDCRIGLTKDDQDMLTYIKAHNLNYLIVANKIDKLSNNELTNVKFKLYKDYPKVIFLSSKNNKGIDQLETYINDYVLK